jgi:hypothetical protein
MHVLQFLNFFLLAPQIEIVETTLPEPIDECFEYNDLLRANGHLVAEVPLHPPETALTLYRKNGKVRTTDGPYAETMDLSEIIKESEQRRRRKDTSR